mgnify:FL=1
MQKLMLKLKKSLINNNFFYKEAGYTEPLELVQNIKKIKFHGLEIKVPSQAEKYLEYLYGPDWETPKRNYSWFKDSPSIITR